MMSSRVTPLRQQRTVCDARSIVINLQTSPGRSRLKTWGKSGAILAMQDQWFYNAAQYDFRLMMFCGNDLRRKTNVSSTHPKHELGRFEPYRVQLLKALQAKTLESKAPRRTAVELFSFPPLIPPQMRCYLRRDVIGR